MLTKPEKKRIADIKRAIANQEKIGRDTSSWEATFFLGVIEKLLKRLDR